MSPFSLRSEALMRTKLAALAPALAVGALMGLTACQDNNQAPPARQEAPPTGSPAGSMLAPLDLVYVCGNKFLATNSTRSPVQVEYRVVGTNETGALTLREGPGVDPGYSETELNTREQGVVELYQDGEQVARRRNEGSACGPSAMSASVAAMGVAETGSWGAPFPWPMVALHLHLLPNGRVLSWGNAGTPHVWDPATGNFSAVPSPAQLFCSGHSFLEDGRLLVSGGHISDDHGLPDNTIFAPSSQSWSRSTPMRRGRWYPTNTTLANGDVVIIAGRDEAGTVVGEPEVWSAGAVRVLSTASLILPYYPRTFLAPNGKVFYAGEERTTRYLDPSGTGSWTTVGSRLYGTRDYGSAVMYDQGKVLYVGGGRTTNTAEIIDLNSATPTWQWTGSMAFARRHLNATMLPTGEVLVMGGTSGTGFNDAGSAVHQAEIWNPVTGTWTTLASNVVNRLYHSTALLLPDGRVLSSGTGDAAGAPRELNAELFSPPYLFNGPRPTITSAPSLVGYGTSFNLGTPDAAAIARVSLIRIGSVTHAFDMNQRFQWLSFQRGAGVLNISAPTSANRTPPGHYLLFILDGNGVPSVAKIVKVGTASEPSPPTNAPPAASFSASCSGLTCNFTDGSSDSDGTVNGRSWDFGEGGGSSATNPTYSYAAGGTYTVILTVTDNDGATATTSRQVTASGAAAPIVLSVTGRQDATKQYMTLTWYGATGAMVDVYKNGAFGIATENDGKYVNSRSFTAPASYTYKVCQTGSSVCSNSATVAFGTPNAAPTSSFASSCGNLSCAFTDGSTDSDGSVTKWQWTFGDGTSSALRNPTKAYAAAGTYMVTLVATDNGNATGTSSKQVTVASAPNTQPTASFTSSCNGLACTFTDGSSDGDGTVTGWSWSFGDGGTSSARSPSYTFGAAGTFTVTLTATDNGGGTGTASKPVTVTATASPIALTVTGRTDATKQYMTLDWTGATGATVDVYRNGVFGINTANDGHYTNSRTFRGAATYTYKVCQAGSTTVCSNEATVAFQ